MIRMRRIERTTDSKPAAIEVEHDGETYAIHVRRNASARRFILRVRNATCDAVLTMPRRAALKDATEFAERNAAWIGVRLRRLPQLVPFAPDHIIPVRGVATRIVHRPQARGVAWLGEDGGERALHVAGGQAHVARRVRDFLKNECRRDLQGAVVKYAQTIGKTAPAVSLRDTKSRWGSCSSAGSLNFSWRLIMAPPQVLDYLAAHEVCHLAHMNHSPKFWSLCRSICPHTDSAEAWLTAKGVDLHRYGSSQSPQPQAWIGATLNDV